MFRYVFGWILVCSLCVIASCRGTQANAYTQRHLQIAEWAMREQEPELARRHIELALQYDPRDARALSALGVLFYIEGEMRKAAWFFEEAVRMRPDFPEAHANWGALLLAQGKYHAAARRLATALYYDPGNDAARWNLVLVLLRLKKYRMAATHLGWYCARTGHSPKIVKLWVDVLYAAGEYQKAEKVKKQYLFNE